MTIFSRKSLERNRYGNGNSHRFPTVDSAARVPAASNVNESGGRFSHESPLGAATGVGQRMGRIGGGGCEADVMLPKAWNASQLTWVALFQVCHPVGDTSRQFHRTAPLQIMAHRCALYLRSPRRSHRVLTEDKDFHGSLCPIVGMKVFGKRSSRRTLLPKTFNIAATTVGWPGAR